MNKQGALVLVGLSLCLGGTAIVKSSVFGCNTKESLDYEFLETEHFKIKYSKSLEKLVKATGDVIEKKLKEYEEFFGRPTKGQIVINFFDNREKYIEFLCGLTGEKISLPYYNNDGTGVFGFRNITIFANPKSQMRHVCVANHEFFHILYMRYTWGNDNSKRFIWYDEGMALFMSGQLDSLKDEDKFLEFYLQVKKNTKTMPNMSVLHHGKEFVNENYHGYHLGYLSVRYLHETLSPEEFKALWSDLDKIKTLGVDIVEKMFKYYD